MTIDGFDFNTIDNSRVDPDSPVDTSLMTDIRDALEFLMRWLGRDFLVGATANHNHDGVGSALVSVSETAGVSLFTYLGNPAVGVVNHPPIEDKAWMLTFSTEAGVDDIEGYFLPFVVEDEPNDGGRVRRFNGTDENGVSASNFPDSKESQHSFRFGSVFTQAGRMTEHILFKQIEGLMVCGSYTGDGNTARLIDISSTSPLLNDFQPDVVIIVNTSITAQQREPVIRTVDHSGDNSTNFESGSFHTDAIVDLNSTGFEIDDNQDVNNSGEEYAYFAFKFGSEEGLTIEKLTSPQSGVQADVSMGNPGSWAFLTLAVRTDATGSNPPQMKTRNHFGTNSNFTAQDGAENFIVNTGIRENRRGEVRLGTGFPNTAGHTSNLIVFSTSSNNSYVHASGLE